MATTVERVPFVDLTAQHDEITGDLRDAIDLVFTRGDFILGEQVTIFEDEFAAYCGAAHAVGVDSGTSALELILRAARIGVGDEVITVANSFVATALAITHTGATPVFVDIDPATGLLDVDALEAAVTPRTSAIVPVHLYGQPVDMDEVMRVAGRHSLLVVEDACQAHGARYRGRRAGAIGDAAAFSFYPSKNLGAAGDGGIVVTSDAALSDTVRRLRNYGQVEKNVIDTPGFNRRLDTLQAALLRVKLGRLDAWNELRRDAASAYLHRLLAVDGVGAPRAIEETEPVWHLFVVRLDDRDDIRSHLASLGVETGIHYPVPIPLQAPYRDHYEIGQFPNAERDAARILSLPMYPHLTTAAIEHVVGALSNALTRV
jgi:dTDP-4-amino-4,6-dideoxygalactose transaminase